LANNRQKIYSLEYNPLSPEEYTDYGLDKGGYKFFEKRVLPEDEQPTYRRDEWSGEEPIRAEMTNPGDMNGSDLGTLAALGLLGYSLIDDSDSTLSGIAKSGYDGIADFASGFNFDPQSLPSSAAPSGAMIVQSPEFSLSGMSPTMATPATYAPVSVFDGGNFANNMAMTDLTMPALYGLGGAGLGYATGGGKQALRSGLGSGIGAWLGSGVTGGSTAGSALGALAGMALAGGDNNPVKKAWKEIKDLF
jgi:hypothetical protein